jgi:chromosome segregation ATPase
MGISKDIKVTTDIDGEYTLSELLKLLGSPKEVKAALASLEAASLAAKGDIEALNSHQRDVDKDIADKRDQLAADRAELRQKSEDLAKREKLFHDVQKDFDERLGANAARETSLNDKATDLKAREKVLADGNKDLAERQAVLDKLQSESNATKAKYEAKLERLMQAID